MIAINETVINKARAKASFSLPEVVRATMMAWQENRLGTSCPRWLIGLARQYGWGVACFQLPPADTRGRLANGGTAILWKLDVGKVKVVRSTELGHRVVAVKTGIATFVSCYGLAKAVKLVAIQSY